MAYELERGKEAYNKSDNKGDDGELFKASEDESTEQFMAVKPWIGALVAPSNRNLFYLTFKHRKLYLMRLIRTSNLNTWTVTDVRILDKTFSGVTVETG